MKYKIRTPDGEVGFDSLQDVAIALRQNLVDLDDELVEVGSPSPPKKVGDIPLLADGIRREKRARSAKPPFLIMGIVIIGCVGVILVAEGQFKLAAVAAFVVTALLSRASYQAFKRKR